MRTVKRLLTLLLAAAMVVSMTACGGSTSSTTDSAAATTAASATAAVPTATAAPTAAASTMEEASASSEASAAEPDRPVISYPLFDDTTTFTLWTSNSPDLSDVISNLDQYLVFKELEKVTNIRWDATLVSFLSSSEQFSLMVASEEYTDVICRATDSYSGSVDQAIDEDFLINLSDLIDQNMPNLQGWFDTYPDLRKQMTSVGGNIAAFPKIYKETSDVTSGGCIRADWLDKVNMDVPTTYDEMHDVLAAFKDKLGATDPLVISVNTGVQSELIDGYNVGAGFYQVDGTIKFGPMQPEYKDYLTMMNQWYNEGLLSKSFLSSQTDNLMSFDTILNGQTGIWYGTGVQSITNLLSMSSDSNMRITGVGGVSTDGKTPHLGEVGQIYDSNMWSISTECSDPASICKYIDYIYGDDGILLANYGVEGETFNYDADGTPKLTELVTNNPDYTYSLALNIYTCDRQTPIPFVIDEDKSRADYSEDQMNAVKAWNAATDGTYNLSRFGVNLTDKETTDYNAIYSDIDTYLDESISKFVVGDTSLDQFDAFVQKLKDMGIEDCISIEQGAYDRYQNS